MKNPFTTQRIFLVTLKYPEPSHSFRSTAFVVTTKSKPNQHIPNKDMYFLPPNIFSWTTHSSILQMQTANVILGAEPIPSKNRRALLGQIQCLSAPISCLLQGKAHQKTRAQRATPRCTFPEANNTQLWVRGVVIKGYYTINYNRFSPLICLIVPEPVQFLPYTFSSNEVLWWTARCQALHIIKPANHLSWSCHLQVSFALPQFCYVTKSYLPPLPHCSPTPDVTLSLYNLFREIFPYLVVPRTVTTLPFPFSLLTLFYCLMATVPV